MRVCTNCRVKFRDGRCPKCRSYQYVREANYSTGSSTSYDTYVEIAVADFSSWSYTTGDSGSSSDSSSSDSSSSYDSGSYDSGSSDSGSSSSD